MSSRPPGRARHALRGLGIALVVGLVSIVLMEGVTALVRFAGALQDSGDMAERRHTRHDPEIGWVQIPGAHVPDQYGPGVGLTINAQGHRGTRETTPEPAPGRLRLVCSGDSFTMGFGVADEETWCTRLMELEPRFETVNLGMGGYGVDQAYLWYLRNASELAHDVHLFCFITNDFERMKETGFSIYPKPRLALQGEELVVENAPVPQMSDLRSWLHWRRDAFGELALGRALGLDRPTKLPPGEPMAEPLAVARAILADLARRARENDQLLVLVHLPLPDDLEPQLPPLTIAWGAFLKAVTRELELPMIDVVSSFRALGKEAARPLYLYGGPVPGMAGHFSAAGNQRAAELIHEGLLALPEVARRLE